MRSPLVVCIFSAANSISVILLSVLIFEVPNSFLIISIALMYDKLYIACGLKSNYMNLQTVILCGGLGTRLKEETEFRPKPMIEIGSKPILWHIIKMYLAHGFSDFVLCLGYRGDYIRNYFANFDVLNNDVTLSFSNGKKLKPLLAQDPATDFKVTLADTGYNAMKGARIKRIEKYIHGDTFMLTYGDGVADINLELLLKFHEKHGRIGTVTGVKPPSRFGEMVVDGERVVSFTEKPQTSSGLINGGFFIFNRKIFDYLTEDDSCDFEVGALEELCKDGELMVYELAGQWACMDTYRDMEYLNRLWRENRAFWKVSK